MTSVMNDSSSRRGISTPSDAHQRRAEAVTTGECGARSRVEIFDAVWRLAGLWSRHDCPDPAEQAGGVPYLLEAGCAAQNRTVKASSAETAKQAAMQSIAHGRC
jgi:hypothetical protein